MRLCSTTAAPAKTAQGSSPAKHFPVRMLNESARLSFRAEFYNLPNQTNFLAPDVNHANATFGRVGSALDPRFVQLALKLTF